MNILNKSNRMFGNFFNEPREDKEMINFSSILVLVVLLLSLFLYVQFSNLGNTQASLVTGTFMIMIIIYFVLHYVDTMQDRYKWKSSLVGIIGFGTKKNAFYGLVLGLVIGGALAISSALPMGNQLFSSLALNVSLSSFMFIVVLAPIIEESFFRGFLMPTFSKILNPLVAIVFVSGAFALMHLVAYGLDFSTLWIPFVFSVLMILVAYSTKSLLPCVVIHFLVNLSIFMGGI